MGRRGEEGGSSKMEGWWGLRGGVGGEGWERRRSL